MRPLVEERSTHEEISELLKRRLGRTYARQRLGIEDRDVVAAEAIDDVDAVADLTDDRIAERRSRGHVLAHLGQSN